MSTTQLILVGGFLGAGKSTLLAQAVTRLRARGRRVGVITNDQAANLVDTSQLVTLGAPVEEVSGGCFCCKFDDLLSAIERLIAHARPDVILAEPVGSCTDLSATVIQPLKRAHGDRVRVAPFSVLVDVRQVGTLDRLRRQYGDAAAPRFPDDVMYIYQKQLEEADVVVLNKADLLAPAEVDEIKAAVARLLPAAPLAVVSALKGDGIEAWLDQVADGAIGGRTIAPVDYDVYAAGEAALGWLNALVELRADGDTDWAAFLRQLITAIRDGLVSQHAEIAHLKLLLDPHAGRPVDQAAAATAGQPLVANLTNNFDLPSVRGAIASGHCQVRLLINARVHMRPEALRATVERCLAGATGTAIHGRIVQIESFAPARPQPTHRYQAVV